MKKHMMLLHMLREGQITPKKIMNLGWNAIAYLLRTEPRMPSLLMLEPTNYCNLRCKLCPTSSMRRPRGFMTFDGFKDVLDKYPFVADYVLVLTLWNFGEPMLNLDVYDMIEHAHRKRVFTRVSTNGHHLNVDKMDKLLLADNIMVALDSLEQENLARYRVGADISTVKRNLELLSEAKRSLHSSTYVEIQFLVMKHNQHEIPAMREYARKLGFGLKLKTIAPQVLGVPHSSSEAEGYMPDGKYARDVTGIRCMLPYMMLTVDWNGNAPVCCLDPEEEHLTGNIFHEGVERVWHGQKMREFRNAADKLAMCENCGWGFPAGEV